MKFFKFSICFALFFLSVNAPALEIRYEGKDCDLQDEPALQSRFVVLGSVGNYYRVRAEGALPPLNKNKPACVDPFFRRGSAHISLINRFAYWEGYAVFSNPFLFVFIEGLRGDDSSAENFTTQHSFVFSKTDDNNFVLLRDEWLGEFEGVIESGSIIYDMPDSIIKYELFN